MIDNEIIKFVEHCMYSAKGEDGFKEIHWEHLKEILDLINRLQAKNKELDEKLVIHKGTIDWQVKEINRQKAEIEELKKGFSADMDYFASEYDTKIKSEAIKEFAEMLKEKATTEQIHYSYRDIVEIRDIDNLVKELTESE